MVPKLGIAFCKYTVILILINVINRKRELMDYL